MTDIKHINTIRQSGRQFLTSNNIQQLLKIKSTRTLEDLIKRLVDGQILTQLERNKYHVTNTTTSNFEIAQFLYPPSYISFETALNYHGILSQFPTIITSTSLKRSTTKTINNITYSYTKLNSKTFTGYYKVGSYLIAQPAKALFDQLYLITKSAKTEEYLDEMDYSNIDLAKITQYLKLISNNRAKLITKLLIKYL